MNGPLFLSTYRRSFRLFASFGLLLILYLLTTLGMFTGGQSDPFEGIPKAMRDAFGIEGGASSLTDFVATGYYGATFVIFLMIYCVIVANQLVAQLVDRGSMAYLLSTPVSRKRVALSQASVLVVNLLAIAVLTTITGLLLGPVITDNAEMNAGAFIRINLVGFLLFFTVGGYSFLFSCLLNEARQALAASGLLSVLFYGFQIVSNMSGNLDWLQSFTILTAFQPGRIAAGSFDVLPVSLLLAASGLALYGAGIWIFSKRDLPL
jgi:ABC-2 type transport system permease protein